jgi:hypothetical protein
MVSGTTKMLVDVTVPNVLYYNPVYWLEFSIGGGQVGYSNKTLAPNPTCNSASFFNASAPPPSFVNVTNPTGMQTFFNLQVLSKNNFNFNASSPFTSQLTTILGQGVNVSVGNFASSVTLDNTQAFVIYTLTIDLNAVIAKCSALGATQLRSSTGTYYSIPVMAVQRDYKNQFVQSTSTFYVSIPTTGTITVGAAAPYQATLSRSEISLQRQGCPAGQGRLVLVYLYKIEYSGTQVVGPRNSSDIAFTSPQYNNSVLNCYNEVVSGFQSQGCLNGYCFYQITTQTECRTLTTDGQAFNNCSNVYTPGTTNYSVSLYQRHDLFITAYSCVTVGVNCRLAVSNAFGLPDLFPTTLLLDVYPETIIQYQFDVYAGFLAYPSEPDPDNLMVLSQVNTTYISSGEDLFNAEVRWNGVLTFVVGMVADAMRQNAVLSININSQFIIVPLDPFGNVVPGGKYLLWGDVFKYMTYVPRKAVTDGYCIACAQVPLTANNTAYDGFSIPVITLRTLMPANGYGVTFDYSFALPDASGNVPQAYTSGRQLLSLESKSASIGHTRKKIMASPGEKRTGSFAFKFFVDETLNPSPLPNVAQTPITVVNNNKTVLAVQWQLRVFPESGTVQTSSVDVIQAAIPVAVAQAFHLDYNQITRVSVAVAEDNHVLSFHGKPHVSSSHRHMHSMAATSDLYADYYMVNLVILPSPLPNATNVFTIALNDASTRIAFSRVLLQHNVLLDQSTPIQTSSCLVEWNAWYAQQATSTSTSANTDVTDMQILFIALFATMVTVICAFGAAAVWKSRKNAVADDQETITLMDVVELFGASSNDSAGASTS